MSLTDYIKQIKNIKTVWIWIDMKLKYEILRGLDGRGRFHG